MAKRISDVPNESLIQIKTGTLDFIKKLRNLKITENFKMLSLDIESLFPFIPLEETISYANEVFIKNSGKHLNKIQIAKLFKFCTENIKLKFGNFCYKQKNGVAMGSPLAPALA